MLSLRASQDGFKSKNQAVDKAFYSVINSSFKDPRKVCKYCYREMDFNTLEDLILQNKSDNGLIDMEDREEQD